MNLTKAQKIFPAYFANFELPNAAREQEYCLSTYFRVNDVRRFVIIDSRFQPPWLLAKGHTTKEDGLSCITREWKKCRGSHVDWWLYLGAEPWLAFEETSYEKEIGTIPAK